MPGIEALARCDREIAEIEARPDVVSGRAPAWLVTLGVNDWTVERDLILREYGGPGRGPQPPLKTSRIL